MAEDIMEVFNETGELVGIPNGIQFHNIHHKSTLSDLFTNEVGQDYNNSCASDEDWKDRKNPEDDLKNLVADVAIDNDEVDDLVGDLNDKDSIQFNDGMVIIMMYNRIEWNIMADDETFQSVQFSDYDRSYIRIE